jgi:hypothetical protein
MVTMGYTWSFRVNIVSLCLHDCLINKFGNGTICFPTIIVLGLHVLVFEHLVFMD